MVNRGTHEGDLAEIDFVKKFNRGSYTKFIDKYFYGSENVYCVHVNTYQHSNTSELPVKPKSDAYLIEVNAKSDILQVLDDFYLNEDMIQNIRHRVIPDSGISIKMADSKNYQIHKFTVNSFLEVFKNPHLGLGAMIYCKKAVELSKNITILNMWKVSEEDFFSYFSQYLSIQKAMTVDVCLSIKNYSVNKIKKIILDDKSIWDLVFNGIGVFQPPYCARYTYINDELREFVGTDFYVTTGSGRLKSPTIVIKPR